MTCMSCTTDRTPSLCLSNEMLPSTCCKYFTFFHSSISHSPLQPTAQLNNSYHLSLRFYNLNKWWVLDIPCCGLIYLLPLKLRLTIIINDNFFLLAKVSACNWVSFAKKDSKCHFRGILKQDDWIEITVDCHHASTTSFDLPEWGVKRRLCLNHIKPLRWPQPKLLDQSILFSLFKLVFLSVASIYLSLITNLWSRPRPL